VVMEQLPGVPLSALSGKSVFQRVTRLAASFHKAAGENWSLEQPPAPPDWEHLLKRAREAIRDNPHIPDASSWAKAVKAAQGALTTLVRIWAARPINTWCHGDLHPGNCMERAEGSVWGTPGDVLFDLAEVHTGHWVEDAVYLERLYWGRPKVLNGAKPVALLAKARREQGLDTSDDYALLANVRRVLMAACVPVFLHREGQPVYLEAALSMLDRLLPQLTK